MIIRYATSQDELAIASVKAFMDVNMSRDITHQRLSAMAGGRAFYLVALQDDILCGHAFLKLNGKPIRPDFPDIEDLFVHPDFRKLGIATGLLTECETITKTHGLSRIGLAVGITDAAIPARALYHKLGYVPIGTAPYVDGIYDGVEDWVIDMVKVLS